VNTLIKSPLSPSKERVEIPISKKVWSGVSVQTLKTQTNKNITEQNEAASAPTYASILKKGVTSLCSFFLINPIVRPVSLTLLIDWL
jgi:hypothetical protein